MTRGSAGSLWQAIVLLFIEGFLLCGFLATFDYAPEANAGYQENSYSPHLNGKQDSLPDTYTRKSLSHLFAAPFLRHPVFRGTPSSPFLFAFLFAVLVCMSGTGVLLALTNEVFGVSRPFEKEKGGEMRK